jgi:NADPH:quinone reductase-like Zn-dependent oxidoreductase
MNSRPDTMLASLQQTVGVPLQVRSLPVPVVRSGHVLVKVSAAGLNPLDVKIRAGMAEHARHPLPAVLGMDMAGVVEAVAPDVDAFSPGDEVFGLIGGVAGVQGSLAQCVSVDAALLARKPLTFSMRDAAATPLIFITAWEGLVDRARVGSGQKVLIHGGGGGVGHVAIQIAKAFGAAVFATGSAAQANTIEALGATFIDYRQQSVADYVQAYTEDEGFDIVFDTVGGQTLDNAFVAVRRYHGHVVSALGWGTHSLAPLSFRAGTYSGVFTLIPLLTGRFREHHGQILRKAAELADAGLLRVRVDARRFDLHTAEQAYQYLASGAASGGKVVVDVA